MVDGQNNNTYRRAAELIHRADALVIGAGAGLGVDSGLPDFRGNEGFWKAYPPLARAQLNFTEVASPRTFETDPKLAWGFYGHRLGLYRATLPHSGFSILQKWGSRMLLGTRIFTSNVDGQFQKAGFSEDQINECHGSIHYLQCMEPCTPSVWAATFTPQVDEETCHLINEAPTCPHCGGLARPNILMFGDWGYTSTRNISQRRPQSAWLQSIADNRARVVVVEMGAGTAIPSVREFSHGLRLEYGAHIVRINLREPAVPSTHDVGIATGALEGLQGIEAELELLNR